MRRCLCAALLLVGTMLPAADEAVLFDRETINLWPKRAPDSNGEGLEDIPALNVILPKAGKATGSSMIVCAGGGYAAMTAGEGTNAAEWLAANGITAFVLRYRLTPKYKHPLALNDAQRAIRFVRAHAAEWKLDPDHIGIMGFGSGGHLAAAASIYSSDGKADADDAVDRVSSKPTIQLLISPVITMGSGTHEPTKLNLLGKKPDPDLVDQLSLEKHIEISTPPAFMVHSTQDQVVPVANSEKYAQALKTAGVVQELLKGAIGPHGFGFIEVWTKPCLNWLRARGF